VFALAAVVVLAAGGFGLLRSMKTETAPSAPTTPRPEPTSAGPSTTATAPSPQPSAAADDDKDDQALEKLKDPEQAKRAMELAKTVMAQAKHVQEHAEKLDPGVAGELIGAEALVETNPTEAVRLARHTLTTQKSSRAYAIITRAFCQLGDLGNAKANLHNVSGMERARVVKACKAAGTDLQ
jgi:serine/threonine-protein kinase